MKFDLAAVLPIGGLAPVLAALQPRAARIERTGNKAAARGVAVRVEFEHGGAGGAVIDQLYC